MTRQGRIPTPAKFQLGQIVATQGALAACDHHHLKTCLYRHSRGDWGNVCAEDKASNEAVFTQPLEKVKLAENRNNARIRQR